MSEWLSAFAAEPLRRDISQGLSPTYHSPITIVAVT